MKSLNDDLSELRELNRFRDRARELRELSLRPLKKILNIMPVDNIKDGHPAEKQTRKAKITSKKFERKNKKDFEINFDQWIFSGDDIEVALLTKVQNNRDFSEDNDENIKAEAAKALKEKLRSTKLENLFRVPDTSGKENTIPVLTAARTMQALVSRAETVFSRATMVCYYRIMRELYEAAPMDWVVGASRAGVGGGTSSFVTGECIRAIFAFQKSIKRTAAFFRYTKILLEDYGHLRKMIESLGADVTPDHPLHVWADKTMELIGLDCYVSTNPRRRQIALSCYKDLNADGIIPNSLRLFSDDVAEKIDVAAVGKYFQSLGTKIKTSLEKVKKEIEQAMKEIKAFRDSEKPDGYDEENISSLTEGEEIRSYERSKSPHFFARRVIQSAFDECVLALNRLEATPTTRKKTKRAVQDEIEESDIPAFKECLDGFIEQSEKLVGNILKVIQPAKRYLKNIIYRELSVSETDFDAGELVFAATALGAMTDWKQQELLQRACELLIKVLPANGRLLTTRPFHTTQNGYRLIPIGCELTTNLAQLFEKVDFAITPQVVGRMLNIFEARQIEVAKTRDGKKLIGWNFDRAPNPTKACVWVTAISVMSLDRIIRMLNTRINETIYKHFEVFHPEKAHTDLKLYDLIYSDHGLSNYFQDDYEGFYYKKSDPPISTAIYLQLMRAHLMRAALPEKYRKKTFPKAYSTILYGPPGTGKTTLAESLALSSEKAVLNLSPSDLIVQGQELIEGRARDVFEALSMLSQAAIIFDEFEPVVKRRGDSEDEQAGGAATPFVKGDAQIFYREIVEQLRILGSKDDPKFKFLLGGMLPKLLKLHDAAKKQSLVYFLATNHLKEIDEAAKRPGRFDTKIPVYNPCPLSRAGTFLYRLSKIDKKIEFGKNKWQVERFLEVIMATAYEPASDLAQKSFKVNSDYFDHVLYKTKQKKFERRLNEPLSENPAKHSPAEVKERKWLNKIEGILKSNSKSIEENANPSVKILKDCLDPSDVK